MPKQHKQRPPVAWRVTGTGVDGDGIPYPVDEIRAASTVGKARYASCKRRGGAFLEYSAYRVPKWDHAIGKVNLPQPDLLATRMSDGGWWKRFKE